jgi:hypothetical protein
VSFLGSQRRKNCWTVNQSIDQMYWQAISIVFRRNHFPHNSEFSHTLIWVNQLKLFSILHDLVDLLMSPSWEWTIFRIRQV